MKLRTALLSATMLAVPLVGLPGMAQAQEGPVSGIYVGAGLGYNILTNEKERGDIATRLPQAHLKFNGGFAGVGSVGYGFGNGFRVELEGDYRSNQIRGATNAVQASGWEQRYGAMVNLIYGFNFNLPVVGVAPYVGVGAGYQWSNYQSVSMRGAGAPAAVGVHGTEGSFAYQAIAGVAFPIEQMPGLAITAEYRFMGLTNKRKFDTVAGRASGRLDVLQGYDNTVLLGVRYNFGVAPPPAPAPAPVAAPAPAPAKTYLVFFDWDKATLTDRAKQIVSEAAENSTKVKYTRIQVNGYTDTSGTPQYNMGLSIRRANAVKAQLITDGVPENVIGIEGFGETHLLVPTGPGVREPQNRRVEIIIQ